MKTRHLVTVLGALALGAVLLGNVPTQAQQDTPPQPEGADVLARGPVHEAYAAPVDQKPRSSVVVPKRPPEPIKELPPDQRPEGEDVRWMSGYWGWDDDRNDFIWISGFWRTSPPRPSMGAGELARSGGRLAVGRRVLGRRRAAGLRDSAAASRPD